MPMFLSLNAACPGPGLRNLPSPNQPDFIWSVGRHVILCSGLQSCLLDEKGWPWQQHWFLSTGLWGDFTPHGLGWLKQAVPWRQGVVSELLDMLSWQDLFRTRQCKDSVLKGAVCWSLAGSFPSIPGPVAVWFCCWFGQEWASSPHPCCRSSLLEKHDHSAVCLVALTALSYHVGCSVALHSVHFMWGGRIQVPGCSEQPGWEVSLILLCPSKPRDWTSVTCGQPPPYQQLLLCDSGGFWQKK